MCTPSWMNTKIEKQYIHCVYYRNISIWFLSIYQNEICTDVPASLLKSSQKIQAYYFNFLPTLSYSIYGGKCLHITRMNITIIWTRMHTTRRVDWQIMYSINMASLVGVISIRLYLKVFLYVWKYFYLASFWVRERHGIFGKHRLCLPSRPNSFEVNLRDYFW